MPTLRGIDVSVVLATDGASLPEIPHPDASSVKLRGPHPNSPASVFGAQPTPAKGKATSSVYIPSSPGAQFHIRYGITTPPPPSSTKYVYFKMLMNGRPIVCWGVKSLVGTQMVSYALYEPDNKWTFRDSGVTYQREGVEKRYFHFSPNTEKSAAMDGGLIEIQVFRSQQRKRVFSELPSFRSQDPYGITSPTGGLVDEPQDLSYYDWLLTDPRDSPYATFRLFYRTWDHLKALNLVTRSQYNHIMAGSQENNLPELNTAKTTTLMTGRTKTTKQEMKAPALPATSGDAGPFDFGPVDGSVFEDGGKFSDKKGRQKFHLSAPPKLAPPMRPSSSVPQPSKSSRGIRQASDSLRPLPALPGAQSNLCRPSLESVRAPSVTPSLLTYVDESSGADEIEFGVARQVAIPVKTPGRSLPAVPPSSSDYDKTPPSTGGLEVSRRIGRYSYTAADARNDKGDTSAGASGTDSLARNFRNTSISESEWLKRSASPLRRKQGEGNLSRRNAEATKEASPSKTNQSY
ncbi:hypothetical protein CkaCkLH20_11734 [Colletotrichum karsti]|uniref:Uncharacterized protein n=1 Tax=Colletotrichum karsti TaxID=1095194 RepID=A0A9P6I2P9_9PEZI|nr:uncharacterized protein CkaCkLH20_11734 [Colletotrichum karsti]KAF9870835.1 hypothetical protein CkaCkLH20_11734 [Colletotrichum karsti]